MTRKNCTECTRKSTETQGKNFLVGKPLEIHYISLEKFS